MRKITKLFPLVCLAVSTFIAHADPVAVDIQRFALSDVVFDNGATLTGTVDINLDYNGEAGPANFTAIQSVDFTYTIGAFSENLTVLTDQADSLVMGTYYLVADDPTGVVGAILVIYVNPPEPAFASFGGYGDGGPLCVVDPIEADAPCGGPGYPYASEVSVGDQSYGAVSGSLVPDPTPEPSTLWLMGTGVVGIAGVLRRRVG